MKSIKTRTMQTLRDIWNTVKQLSIWVVKCHKKFQLNQSTKTTTRYWIFATTSYSGKLWNIGDQYTIIITRTIKISKDMITCFIILNVDDENRTNSFFSKLNTRCLKETLLSNRTLLPSWTISAHHTIYNH